MAMNKKKLSRIGLAVFQIVFLSMMILPFLWLILGSFKNMRELSAIPVKIFPEVWSLDNFRQAFEEQPFARYIFNSVVVAALTTVLIIVIASMTAYSLARTKIKGKKLILILLLSVSLLPPVTLLNPLYYMLSNMKLLNSLIGLSLVLTVVELPTAVWFLTSFFQTVPIDMEESAMIDGAGILKTFTSIILPLIGPGIFTISIMTFINAWNNYIFPSVFNPLPKARTVTVALTLYSTETMVPWHLISAAAVVVTLPLVIVVLLLQKKIISGIMDGGVKG